MFKPHHWLTALCLCQLGQACRPEDKPKPPPTVAPKRPQFRSRQLQAYSRPNCRATKARFSPRKPAPKATSRSMSPSVEPLRVSARVLHRRHRKEARELACEATKSQRGRAFIAAARARGEATFDGCRAEPITLVAQADVQLGAAPQPSARPIWQRLYDHALGLSLSVQEDLGEARWSALRAWADLERSQGIEAAQHAKVLTLLGRISARQGRLDEALDYAARAQTLIGDHPAVERVRADAYSQVWKWKEAAASLTTLTQLAPGDTAAWRDLAKARFSAGDPGGALQASQSGMGLQPRDEGCLRVQALALEALKSPDAAKARESFLFYREADETSSARMACDTVVPNCSRDRNPVVKIELGRAGTNKWLAEAARPQR